MKLKIRLFLCIDDSPDFWLRCKKAPGGLPRICDFIPTAEKIQPLRKNLSGLPFGRYFAK
jgi:hypothetical protein